MKYLLHGDDIVASRKIISDLTEGFSTTNLEGKDITLSILEENLLSNSLFDDKKAVVVENLFLKNKNKKEILKFLKDTEIKTLLIFWESGKVRKTSIPNIKDLTIREFSLPSNYFLFLDSFAPGSKSRVFTLFQSLLRVQSEELIFYSLLKRLRLLLMLSENATSSKDFVSMSPWQMDKLKKQLRLWDKNRLFTIYSQLEETEVKLKSGGLPASLSKHLDILILSEL